jgi:hypothetical protein
LIRRGHPGQNETEPANRAADHDVRRQAWFVVYHGNYGLPSLTGTPARPLATIEGPRS